MTDDRPRGLAAFLALLVLVGAPGLSRGEEPRPAREGSALAISPRMETWVARVAPGGTDREVLAALAAALVDRGWRERDDRTLTAQEAFERREGDCVSFAFALAGLARSRGVPARLAVHEPRSWIENADLEVATGHMVAALREGGELVVYDVLGENDPGDGDRPFRLLTDAEALAVFHANRGAGLILAGRPVESVSELEVAVALAPDLASAWVNLGVALRRAGRLAEAEGAYRRALRLAPRSVDAWRNLAILLELRVERGATSSVDGSP